MAISVAAGYPQHSGTFIPEKWSLNLLVQYYANDVIPQISNSNYVNEIKQSGDIIKIRTRPTITWHSLVKGQDMTPDFPTAPIVEFPIERAGYFYFAVDNIDAFQSDIDMMSDWAQGAVMDSKNAIDTAFLADIYADADADNIGATAGVKSNNINMGAAGAPITLTAENILQKYVAAGVVLSEQNVPNDRNRWAVMPPYALGLISLSDIKDASLSGDGTSLLRTGTGRVGRISNFTTYESTQLTSVTDGTTSDTCYYLIFGHIDAVAFAAQYIETVHFEKLERMNGQAMRTTQAYDWKALRGEALTYLYATFADNEF